MTKIKHNISDRMFLVLAWICILSLPVASILWYILEAIGFIKRG